MPISEARVSFSPPSDLRASRPGSGEARAAAPLSVHVALGFRPVKVRKSRSAPGSRESLPRAAVEWLLRAVPGSPARLRCLQSRVSPSFLCRTCLSSRVNPPGPRALLSRGRRSRCAGGLSGCSCGYRGDASQGTSGTRSGPSCCFGRDRSIGVLASLSVGAVLQWRRLGPEVFFPDGSQPQVPDLGQRGL